MKTLQDISAPAEVTRKLLEKDVQKQCVDWARARGYWARKFSSMTQRSVPDYLFSHRGAEHTGQIVFACEFKAPGKAATDAQLEELDAMIRAGWLVFECDNFEAFKTWVVGYENSLC